MVLQSVGVRVTGILYNIDQIYFMILLMGNAKCLQDKLTIVRGYDVQRRETIYP